MASPRPPATLPEHAFAVRRWLLLHRRWVAAALAFASVLCIVQVLAPRETQVSAAGGRAAVEVDADLVQFPLRLADSEVARLLAAGDVVDVIGSEVRGATSMVAESLPVVGVQPSTDGAFGGGGDALVLVAVSRDVALDLAAATSRGPVTVAVHQSAPSQ